MKKQLHKKRKVYDDETTISEILQHSFVNFLFGFMGGVVILSLTIGNPYLILVAYYILKQIESKILNRNKYTSKLGKQYIFPIPSTIGFFLSWYLNELLKPFL